MADSIDDLTVRVETVEAEMALVPATIDQRFDAVDVAIAEQRRYTEFAFDTLERRMHAGFAEVKAELKAISGVTSELKAEMTEVKRDLSGSIGRVERKLDQFIDRFTPPLPPGTRQSSE